MGEGSGLYSGSRGEGASCLKRARSTARRNSQVLGLQIESLVGMRRDRMKGGSQFRIRTEVHIWNEGRTNLRVT
jgi:hypothetical protein